MLKTRMILALFTSLLCFSAHAFELSKWVGVWERYSATGQVEERITAKEIIKNKLISSQIEYFKDGSPVGDGATVTSDLKGKVRASMHFTNGMQIELNTLERKDDSVFFQLSRLNLATGEKTAEMYTRFTYMLKEDKEVIRQDLFKDKEQREKLLSVDFYKQS